MNKLAYYTGYMEKEALTELEDRGNTWSEMGGDALDAAGTTATLSSRLVDPSLLYRQGKRALQGGWEGIKSGGKKGWNIGKDIGTYAGGAGGAVAGGLYGNSLAKALNMGNKAKLASILGFGLAGGAGGAVAGRYGAGVLGAGVGANVGGHYGAYKGLIKNAPLWAKNVQ